MFSLMVMLLALLQMITLMVLRRKKYQTTAFHAVLLAILSMIMGVLGTRVMYFIENGNWHGNSFFGAIFFFPPFLFPIAWLFKLKLSDLLDYATPPGMLMLSIVKINCWHNFCCSGRVLWYTEQGVPVYFPSQLVEMAVAFLVASYLLYIEHKGTKPGQIYATCITLYGTCRFILNWFRWNQNEFVLGMPPGTFWSICAVVIGIVWLIIIHLKAKKVKSS